MSEVSAFLFTIMIAALGIVIFDAIAQRLCGDPDIGGE